MKIYNWSIEKNIILKKERNIGFEDALAAINEGNILDIIKHSNRAKYPNQKIFILNINNYAYLVPFVEDKNEIFFKTIIPSRKAAKKYILKI